MDSNLGFSNEQSWWLQKDIFRLKLVTTLRGKFWEKNLELGEVPLMCYLEVMVMEFLRDPE